MTVSCRRPGCAYAVRGRRVYCSRLCRLLDNRRMAEVYRQQRRDHKYLALYEDMARMMPISSLALWV